MIKALKTHNLTTAKLLPCASFRGIIAVLRVAPQAGATAPQPHLKALAASPLPSDDKSQSEKLLYEQKHLLEHIASGRGLNECLAELCAAVARLSPDTHAVIILADAASKSFEQVICPDLPATFKAGLQGKPIDDSRIGTCSHAVFTSQQVSCADISQDKYWSQAWRDLCLSSGFRACHSIPLLLPSGSAVGSFALCFEVAREANEWDLSIARFATDIATIALVCQRSEQALREREAWQVGQTEALRAALNGEPLTTSLGHLSHLATQHMGPDTRAAFYQGNAEGTRLYHIVGMGEDYAREIDGFPIGPDSASCGLAAHNGQPQITTDVREDPVWQPWLWLTEKFDYRSSWSFPIASSRGNFIGSLAVYTRQPRTPTPRDLHLTSLLSETASIIIAQHKEADERRRAEKQIEEELADTKMLHDISAAIIHEDDAQTLYEKIMDASVAIMRSDFSSLQMLHPERGDGGQLHLLASRGYDLDAAKFWEWVRTDSSCTCGVAMKTGQRAIAVDVSTCDFLMGSSDQENALRMGMHAMQSTPLISRSGKLVGMISTHWRQPHSPSERDCRIFDILARQAADLIERKRAEEALHEAKEKAEAASRAKDDFLAQLSHELRTPLTPVLMTATALRDDESLPTDVREQLSMIQRNVALEARLIDDLLDITRITRGKLALREELCDLHSLLGNVVEIVREDAREKEIEIVIELRAKRSHLFGDPARLQQVFWNLLRNAVKFTPARGHVRIVSHDGVCSHDNGQEPTGCFCAIVTDSGIGFEPTAAARLFTPFSQEDNHGFGGLGLGLSIANAIVDMHGGALRAESAGYNRGAAFTVELPGSIVMPNGAVNQAGENADVPVEPPLRLLLVEDHMATLQVLSRLLGNRGHHVVTASTVADARAAAAQANFDVVISDLGLPDGTGIELMAHLRDVHGLRGIALSGYGMDEDLRRSKEAGFAAHLIKPVETSELRRVLRTLVLRE